MIIADIFTVPFFLISYYWSPKLRIIDLVVHEVLKVGDHWLRGRVTNRIRSTIKVHRSSLLLFSGLVLGSLKWFSLLRFLAARSPKDWRKFKVRFHGKLQSALHKRVLYIGHHMEHEVRGYWMTKLNGGSTPSLSAFDPESATGLWCKKINHRP